MFVLHCVCLDQAPVLDALKGTFHFLYLNLNRCLTDASAPRVEIQNLPLIEELRNPLQVCEIDYVMIWHRDLSPVTVSPRDFICVRLTWKAPFAGERGGEGAERNAA